MSTTLSYYLMYELRELMKKKEWGIIKKNINQE